jgi:hypothetical protein
MKRRRPLVLPVVLVGASAIGCFGGGAQEFFDSATGCCQFEGNASVSGLEDCSDDGDHPDAVCCVDEDDDGDVECDTGAGFP